MSVPMRFPMTTLWGPFRKMPWKPFAETMLPAPGNAPPISTPWFTSNPWFPLPIGTEPLKSVPTRLPCTSDPGERISIPFLVLPETRLPAPGAVPPTRVSGEFWPMYTPVWLARAMVPVASVPMRLPWITLPVASGPELSYPPQTITPPDSELPDITLPAPGVTPPMTLCDPWYTKTPPQGLATGLAPVASVPMRLPSTELWSASI